MDDLDALTPKDFGLDRPIYPVSDLLREKKVPWGRTTFYEKVKTGEIELARSGNRSFVTTPVLVKLLKKLMASGSKQEAA
jgi:hypothetical protein